MLFACGFREKIVEQFMLPTFEIQQLAEAAGHSQVMTISAVSSDVTALDRSLESGSHLLASLDHANETSRCSLPKSRLC